MEVIWQLFPTVWLRRKRYQLFKYTFDLSLLKGPSTDMYLFWMSCNFIRTWSIQSLLALLSGSHPTGCSDSSNLGGQWGSCDREGSSWLLPFISNSSVFTPRADQSCGSAGDSKAFPLRNTIEQWKSWAFWCRPLKTWLYWGVLKPPWRGTH